MQGKANLLGGAGILAVWVAAVSLAYCSVNNTTRVGCAENWPGEVVEKAPLPPPLSQAEEQLAEQPVRASPPHCAALNIPWPRRCWLSRGTHHHRLTCMIFVQVELAEDAVQEIVDQTGATHCDKLASPWQQLLQPPRVIG